MSVIIGRYDAWLTDTFCVKPGEVYDTETNSHAAAAFERHPDAFEVPNVEPKRGPGRPRKEDGGV
jgi:hypothetical protein